MNPEVSQTVVDGILYLGINSNMVISPFDLPFFMAIPGQLPVQGVGVNESWYNVDDGIWQIYTSPFSPVDLGITSGRHLIGYLSFDWLGNMEVAG